MRKLVLVLVCATFSIGSVFAQQKIGHLNSDELLVLMPEAKMVNDSLQASQLEKQQQVAALQAELQ